MATVKVPDVPAVLSESEDDMAQAMGALFESLVTKARTYYDTIDRYATQDSKILAQIETSTDEACVAYRQAKLDGEAKLKAKRDALNEARKALEAAEKEGEQTLAPLEQSARKAASSPDDVTVEQLAKASEGVRSVASTAAKNVGLLKAMTSIDLGDWSIPVITTRGTKASLTGDTDFTPSFSRIVVNGVEQKYTKMWELAKDLKVQRASIVSRMETTLGASGLPGRQVWQNLSVGDEAKFTLTVKGSPSPDNDKVYVIVVTKTQKGANEPADTPDPTEDESEVTETVVETTETPSES